MAIATQEPETIHQVPTAVLATTVLIMAITAAAPIITLQIPIATTPITQTGTITPLQHVIPDLTTPDVQVATEALVAEVSVEAEGVVAVPEVVVAADNRC